MKRLILFSICFAGYYLTLGQTVCPLGQNVAENKTVIRRAGGVTYGQFKDDVDFNTTTSSPCGGNWLNVTNNNFGTYQVVDLGAIYRINAIGYSFMWDGYYNNPLTFNVEVSLNDTNYFLVSSVTYPGTNNYQNVNYLIDDTLARFIKYSMPPDGQGNGWGGWFHLRAFTNGTTAPSISADCVKGCAPLTVNFMDSTNYTNFPKPKILWDFGEDSSFNDTSSLANPQYTFNSPGIYKVVFDANNCWNCKISDTILIEVLNVTPVFIGNDTVICPDNILTLNAGNEHNSYLWSTSDTTNTITLVGSDLGIGNHVISCEASLNFKNCSTSANVTVTVEPCLGIKENNKYFVNIFPVPASENINISINNHTIGASYIIKDLYGKIILNGKLLEKETKIPITMVPSGIYFLEINNNEEKIISSKIIKL
jgi:PKD repeat protein